LPRKPRAPQPQPTLLFSGISEQQWQFLRLRAFDESDAVSARGVGISARNVEGWKRRNAYFRALYAFALAQPRLFASGSLFWSLPAASAKPRLPALAQLDVPLVQSGLLLSREHPDVPFEREIRQREFTISSRPENQPPPVDLDIPDQHRRIVEPEREMDDGERRLAEALGVEHCLVLGYWNGEPLRAEPSWYERAVDVPSEYTYGFRMEKWFPDGVIATSVGLIVLSDGTVPEEVRCPVKRRRRCPLVDLRGVGFASCSYWDYALTNWLDIEPPNENTRNPICHRDFAIARLLVYLASVTRRQYGTSGGHSAGFPVITVRSADERSSWTARAEQWNKMLLDPWRRIRIVDCDVLVDALVGLRMREYRAEVEEVGIHAQ
jgi:hypothetical protein